MELASRRVADFAIRYEQAKSGAAPSWANAPISITRSPGRRISNAPINPIRTAATR